MIHSEPLLGDCFGFEVKLGYPSDVELAITKSIATLELESIFEVFVSKYGAVIGNDIITKAFEIYLQHRRDD